MSGKRPHDFDDDDSDNKRIRSNNGSPAPSPAASNANADKAKVNDRIAALKAKLAAAKQRPTDVPDATTSSNVQSQRLDLDQRRAEAQRRAEEIRARHNGGSPASNGAPSGQATAQEKTATDLQARIAEAKARAAALARDRSSAPSPVQQQVASDLQTRIAEARARAAELRQQREHATPSPAPAVRQEGNSARGGLGVGLHPSLLMKPEPVPAKKSQAPKFSTTKGNQAQQQEKSNPYLPGESEVDTRHDGAYDPSIAKHRADRKSKPLAFVAQGKYIAQSIAMKEQAELEAMKRRIALESRKVRIEEAGDKSFLVPAPPELEWWDDGLLKEGHKTYDDWERYNRIEDKDSIITVYVQHPVLLTAPQEKFMPAPKPMMLTKKEQKKLRRQRRLADMKEIQARIRLGDMEAPPPKVKKSNMMRVYGEQAVKDPTAVEARVNREIAERADTHERMNEDRKLTKEQRAEKLERQQAGDEAKGVRLAVFRVDNLSSGKQRYQIDINAKQNKLTGLVILHPDMNLVIIEGGHHSVEAYKKLMLKRIKWSENTMPLSNNSSSTFTAAAGRNINRDLMEGPSAIDTWLNPLTDRGELKDLSDNQCLLVWEGDERQRSYRKWGSRVCETDGEARDALARNKMENMWALAKGTTA